MTEVHEIQEDAKNPGVMCVMERRTPQEDVEVHVSGVVADMANESGLSRTYTPYLKEQSTYGLRDSKSASDCSDSIIR